MRNLAIYARLAALSWPRSYVGKFLLTAFLGVHVPLIAIVVYVALGSRDWAAALPVLGVALAATLGGTLATLYVQGRLLAPLLRTSDALQAYLARREVPELPTGYTDEAGSLMRSAQECAEHLDALIRLKGDLLAVLSHDIRSPLTSISAANDLARLELARPVAEMEVEELREYTDIIRDAVGRQLALMNDILFLARAESGRVEVSRERAAPAELVRRAVDGVRMQARQKGVELSVAAVPGDDVLVALDVPRTLQVLANLLQNAVKFTPAGGSVAAGAALGGGEVEFQVRDTGVGLRPEDAKHLFQRFSAGQRAGTASEGGSGLGLWICKTFTELQGGRITAEGLPGGGSCFRVRLPAATEAPAAPEPAAPGALAA
jgi:signal transduction histidine kinase